ncbi:B3/B4 domain-containing protein [Lysinibacillus pakistanensis]|uniref:Phenylalanine--tRNA ligase beta subunit-related protein n=1 Tax=Lysinibacillus pakistanensis TaxID=759811 RepID=A0AAX3WV10_9BACI|nr:phenylalanine--tRNA ligase beta subunit-related protein [Lysinibacillus pakistanensis]MDM5230357.1 phenylalanine--tRNA ligase beta subunit-related protein [Lysinibacillus pakistanensis]WHY45940.1 phenylalanine--tRNA ligase beta subunit-related protein [Lysinibacillus pakistanensis]WHY50952.1 phenylalanine--tRNA ligase beta subunit-related protein [Lysinibacillus pakistanensis]
MDISINQSLLTQHPELKFGIIHYTKIVVAESPQMIKGRMQLYQENLYIEMQENPVTQREGIAEWRRLWKKLGADPNRYRHSAESLMRRISKQNYLTPYHSGVDLNNFFSLQYEIPVGLYDVDQLQGDIEIALGNEDTGYEGLNGRFNSLNKILYSYDAEGAFGSPFVDSKRTSVSEETTEALQIFYLRPSLTEENATKLLASAGKMFNQIHGGDYNITLLTNVVPATTL